MRVRDDVQFHARAWAAFRTLTWGAVAGGIGGGAVGVGGPRVRPPGGTGAVGPPPRGSSLGGRREEVEPPFARVIVALARPAPAAIGDALRGRAMDAWWGEVAPLPEMRADDVTARLGILFEPLEIAAMLQPSLEAVADRVLVRGRGRPPRAFAPW